MGMNGAAAGAAGVLLSIAGTGLYLRDMRLGRTRPHRGSWLVWSVIAVTAALSHGAGGGRWSLVVLCCQAAGTLAVLAAAVRCGTAWFTPLNALMFVVAMLGLLGWMTFSDPIAATCCAAVADGAGLLAMLPKVWTDPGSETLATYALAGLTGLLAVVAVGGWDLNLLLFPAYFCLGNSSTAAVIMLRRRALRPARSDTAFAAVDAGGAAEPDLHQPVRTVRDEQPAAIAGGLRGEGVSILGIHVERLVQQEGVGAG